MIRHSGVDVNFIGVAVSVFLRAASRRFTPTIPERDIVVRHVERQRGRGVRDARGSGTGEELKGASDGASKVSAIGRGARNAPILRLQLRARAIA